jgi:hypothetical protein
MPWCENTECGKKNLKKDEVIFDDTNQKVLCVPCGQKVSSSNQTLTGEIIDKTFFGAHYASDQGLHVEVIHRGARIDFRASNDQILNILNKFGIQGPTRAIHHW